MPRLIEYSRVLAAAEQDGLKSLYHNSGAFGFKTGEPKSVGWVTGEDPSIRETARPLMRLVSPPTVERLGGMFAAAAGYLPGEVWVMPKSHWAYELQFGSSKALPLRLREMGIDPAPMTNLTAAAAVAFDDAEAARPFVTELLSTLDGSDFAAMFPGRRTVVTIHHHNQLWWTTTDAAVFDGLESIAGRA